MSLDCGSAEFESCRDVVEDKAKGLYPTVNIGGKGSWWHDSDVPEHLIWLEDAGEFQNSSCNESYYDRDAERYWIQSNEWVRAFGRHISKRFIWGRWKWHDYPDGERKWRLRFYVNRQDSLDV